MDDDDNDNLLILTGGELLDVGLDLIGYTDAMVLRASEDSNEERFQRLYGSSAFACAQLWEALQVTAIDEARIEGTLTQLEKYLLAFLMALHWLTCYPTETQREALFKKSPKTLRQWGWDIVDKIAALHDEKVSLRDVLSPSIQLYLTASLRSFSQQSGATT
jgi:hypothetical protein